MTERARSRPPLGRQLFRFVVVGGFSALVDFGLLLLGMRLGLDHTSAKAVSFVTGTTTAYALNRRWTFAAAGSKRKFLAVVALYLVTFAVQVGLFAALYPLLATLASRLVAQTVGFVIAQSVATIVNFLVQRAVIFRH